MQCHGRHWARQRVAAVVWLAACSSTACADVEDACAGYPGGTNQIIVPFAPVGFDSLVAEWASPWIA